MSDDAFHTRVNTLSGTSRPMMDAVCSSRFGSSGSLSRRAMMTP